MSEPTEKELQESIEELTAYRDRLLKEIVTIAQKLRMPQKKIDSTVAEHSELKNLDVILSQLISQRDGLKSP